MNQYLRLKRRRSYKTRYTLTTLELRGSIAHFASYIRVHRAALEGLDELVEKRDYLGIPEAPTHVSSRALHRQFEAKYGMGSKYLSFLREFQIVTKIGVNKRVTYKRRTPSGTLTTMTGIPMFLVSDLYGDP